MEEVKSKRQTKVKKVFGWIGLSVLSVLALGFMYDHKKDISSGAIKTAGWLTAKVNNAVDAVKAIKKS